MALGTAEYIWIDGNEPPRMRSKIRVIEYDLATDPGQNFTFCRVEMPKWNFDGSSTNQADGDNSDVTLIPVKSVQWPANSGHWLVLCECYVGDEPAKGNHRAALKELLDSGVREKHEPWVGFEQEYVIFDPEHGRPMGFPSQPNSFPRAQGLYYCGVDGDVAHGRAISDEHLFNCLEAGLMIYGTNAEVMPGQWEFQMGYRRSGDAPDPLKMSDELWLARYMLFKVAEASGKYISLDCKPMLGDWNGSGCHTNFSTKSMREKDGLSEIHEAISKLEATHSEHISVYGYGLEARLTGQHETCDIKQFKSGVADRTASIRIPASVQEAGSGYFEDRRPGANMDPYRVSHRLLTTLCAG